MGITNVIIPANVRNLSGTAFACPNLEHIQVADANEFFFTKDGILYSKDKSKLLLCPRVKTGTLEIPTGVVEIGPYAFYDCDNLTKIILPDGVTTIGYSAFYGIDNLKTVILPDTVRTIEASAFSGCSNLTDMHLPGELRELRNFAFSRCTSIASLNIPPYAAITNEWNVWVNPFSQCSNLQYFYQDGENPNLCLDGGVLYSKDKTILMCCPAGKKGDCVIPDGVVTIAQDAFLAPGNINSITIPASVVTIGSEEFKDNPDIIFYGYLGSKAEEYATKRQITFIPLDPGVKNLYACTVTLSETSYIYDGTEKKRRFCSLGG